MLYKMLFNLPEYFIVFQDSERETRLKIMMDYVWLGTVLALLPLGLPSFYIAVK